MKMWFACKSNNIRFGYYDSDLDKVFVQFYKGKFKNKFKKYNKNPANVEDRDLTDCCDEELLVYFRTLSLVNGESYIKFPLYRVNENIVEFDPNLDDIIEE